MSGRLSAVAQRVARALRLPQAWVWRFGRADEVEFWDGYLASGGGRWQDEFARRTDPTAGFDRELAALIDAPEGSVVRVLDVGSGPLTCLGAQWAGRSVEIVATDPLADDYARIMARHGVRPLVAPLEVQAEHLADAFPADHFDLVHARNSIDHCHDAPRAIRQMLAVVKPGGCVFLRHHPNEAEHANYSGFHQWNLCREDGEFVVRNPRTRFSVTRELADVAEVQCELVGDEWVVARIFKRPRARREMIGSETI